MSETVIKVENLSKQYRLGVTGTGTLSHDLNRWWHLARGKEDPYQKIGETNEQSTKSEIGYVWALKDINFEVQQGEVLGIIGKNGAGKSTLLKILSKVTGPTTGKIKAKGRIASLLEVGTGFHPELTGRENIYLNGTILGMTRREVSRKLDEIVDFAGVARYLDTPVKRYSSGMKVRLGFAVAAHLEPEILIVDEVLAVGDAEFQKKAVGKMQEVSHEGGRTVLFVSHNMSSVRNLCDNGILLENGEIVKRGSAESAVGYYLNPEQSGKREHLFEGTDGQVKIQGIKVFEANQESAVIKYENPFSIEVQMYVNKISQQRFDLGIRVTDFKGEFLFVSGTANLPNGIPEGNCRLKVEVPGCLLNEGTFYAGFLISENRRKSIGKIDNIISWSILPPILENGGWMGKTVGAFKPILNWEICDV